MQNKLCRTLGSVKKYLIKRSTRTRKEISAIICIICKSIRYRLVDVGNKNPKQDLQANALQEGMLIFIVNFVKDRQDEVEMARSFKALDLNKDGVLSL